MKIVPTFRLESMVRWSHWFRDYHQISQILVRLFWSNSRSFRCYFNQDLLKHQHQITSKCYKALIQIGVSTPDDLKREVDLSPPHCSPRNEINAESRNGIIFHFYCSPLKNFSAALNKRLEARGTIELILALSGEQSRGPLNVPQSMPPPPPHPWIPSHHHQSNPRLTIVSFVVRLVKTRSLREQCSVHSVLYWWQTVSTEKVVWQCIHEL